MKTKQADDNKRRYLYYKLANESDALAVASKNASYGIRSSEQEVEKLIQRIDKIWEDIRSQTL